MKDCLAVLFPTAVGRKSGDDSGARSRENAQPPAHSRRAAAAIPGITPERIELRTVYPISLFVSSTEGAIPAGG
jgi:hypothetical protein